MINQGHIKLEVARTAAVGSGHSLSLLYIVRKLDKKSIREKQLNLIHFQNELL